MFRQIVEDWRAVSPARMTEETRAELVAGHTVIAERFGRRGERTARADAERLR